MKKFHQFISTTAQVGSLET